jgi:hypothetical protein
VDRNSSNTNDVYVHPNPAKNMFNNKLNNVTSKGEVFLLDNLGKIVQQQNLNTGNNVINIADLSKGIYMVNIKTKQGTNIEKLVIE